MSKVAELAYDIEQLYIEGLHPTKIAQELGCPLTMIYDWLEEQSLDTEEVVDPSVSQAVFARMVEDLSPFETMNS
jgi:DNA-directed RNA polymerase specialized sigma24 family protein